MISFELQCHADHLSLVPRREEGGGEKGAPGVYCMCIGINFPKFLKIQRASPLHWLLWGCQFLLCGRCISQPRSVWTMTREWQKHSAFRLQKWSMRLSIPAKCYHKWWCNLSFEVYKCLEQSDADHHRQSDIISDFKSVQMFLARSIALQCGLSAGKLKIVVILV